MIEVIFLWVLALIWIIFASIQDLRTREVSNWIGGSLVIFALGFRFFYSLFSETISFGFFYQGLIGLGIFFVLGNVLYYARLFAGGDAKLMMALGPVLAFSDNFMINLKIFVSFFFLFLFAGAIYGLIITISLSLKNFKSFKKEFVVQFRKNKKKFFLGVLLGLIVMILGIQESLFFTLGIILFAFPYLYLYAKAVDEKCMIKDIKVKDLTEGDWLYKDVKVKGRTIKATWGGIEKKDINDLRKKYKKVKIRQGIPYVPVFLIAFVVLIYIWQFGLWNAFW